jgi:hypothetical protein
MGTTGSEARGVDSALQTVIPLDGIQHASQLRPVWGRRVDSSGEARHPRLPVLTALRHAPDTLTTSSAPGLTESDFLKPSRQILPAMTLQASPRTLVAVAILAIACAPLEAQSRARLWDGTIVTQKQPLEFFFTEGPVWNLDVAGRQIFCAGKAVHIPALIDGVQPAIAGTELLDGAGVSIGPVTAATFDRLVDSVAHAARDLNSAGVNLGPRRLGPVRSIYSSTEAGRSAPPGSGLLREPSALASLKNTFWDTVQSTYQLHAERLPADYLDRVGMVGTDPANWIYPAYVGGTLKSAGHVYADANRNEYFIPDLDLVFEFAENLTTGTITSAERGTGLTPDSFVIDDTLMVIMNQDPRVPSEILGAGLAPVKRERFFDQVIAGVTTCEMAGYFVSENLFYAQEVIVPTIVEPYADITMAAEGFRIRADRGEMRFSGFIDNYHGVDVYVVVGQQAFLQTLTVDPAFEGLVFNFRQRGLPNLANETEIRLEARDQVYNFVLSSITYDITEFIQ